MVKALRVFILLLVMPLWSLADDQIPKDFDAVRIDMMETADTTSTDQFTINYDPAQLKDAPKIEMTFDELSKLSASMAKPEFQSELETKIQIPISTATPENLEIAKTLSPEELTTFLSKKSKFLSKVANTLTFLRLKPKSVNKLIYMMNDHFFKNAGVIANANTRVITLQLGIGGGFGLSDWMMAQLKRSPYLKDLPERSGFYFLVGAGVSIGRTVLPNGKSRFFIEPVVELRRSTKIFSPFVFGAAGFQGGYTWENRSHPDSIQTASFYKVSMVNVINGGQNFGFNAAAAAVFPPGGGAIAGIEGKLYRLRITPAIVSNLWSTIKQFVSHGGGIRCEGVFQ